MASSSSATARGDVAMCQAVLDLPPLTQYFHPEVAGRVPVVVVRSGTACDDLPLSAAGAPVVFRSRADVAKGSPFLELTEVNAGSSSASVRLTYPLEGVVGSVDLERKGSTWTVTKHEIAER